MCRLYSIHNRSKYLKISNVSSSLTGLELHSQDGMSHLKEMMRGADRSSSCRVFVPGKRLSCVSYKTNIAHFSSRTVTQTSDGKKASITQPRDTAWYGLLWNPVTSSEYTPGLIYIF